MNSFTEIYSAYKDKTLEIKKIVDRVIDDYFDAYPYSSLKKDTLLYDIFLDWGGFSVLFYEEPCTFFDDSYDLHSKYNQSVSTHGEMMEVNREAYRDYQELFSMLKKDIENKKLDVTMHIIGYIMPAHCFE